MNTYSTTLTKSLKLFEKLQEVDPSIPIHYIICLHIIALKPGLTISELAEEASIQLSTVSRIVGALSKWRQSGEAYDLITVTQDKDERRKKRLHLTDKGEALAQTIDQIMREEA